MPCTRTLITLVIFSFSSHFLFAQASTSTSKGFTAKGITLTEAEDQDWSIYNDEENNIYFIDFEKINFNLSEVVVFDQSNEVVFKEDVFDLPVNTIYELDFKPFGAGEFKIELRSFTKYIQKDVSVR